MVSLSLSLSHSPSLSLFFLSVDLFPSLKETVDSFYALFLCLALFYFNSTLSLYPAFFFLSFFHFFPSLSLSLCSAALPVGVKLGECDRKREAAGREMKDCRRREKRKGDNEKPDLGS